MEGGRWFGGLSVVMIRWVMGGRGGKSAGGGVEDVTDEAKNCGVTKRRELHRDVQCGCSEFIIKFVSNNNQTAAL